MQVRLCLLRLLQHDSKYVPFLAFFCDNQSVALIVTKQRSFFSKNHSVFSYTVFSFALVLKPLVRGFEKQQGQQSLALLALLLLEEK